VFLGGMISAPDHAREIVLPMPDSCFVPDANPFQRLRGTTHHLVLFAGALATGETHRRLQALADATMHAYPNRIEPHLIVPHELPEDLVCKGEILLDPKGELHHRYGARNACLYVVRPDGYVGFRSQPPDPEALKSYLAQIFL
jgi:hypothetical protein